MTDREMLELAAKAAGITGKVEEGEETWFWILKPGERRHTDGDYWNPLTDDGDALRLAVKLNINVTPNYHADAPGIAVFVDETTDDPYAVTRRAIVQVAAEIGKDLK